MIQKVVKRDGRVVDFNNQKIVAAILKAMNVTDQGEDIILAAQIADVISKLEKEQMSVEEIQDCVEMELMNSPRKEVAKRYIAYRNQRSLARNAKSNEIFQEIIDAQANDITRENANMNADTPAGMMMKFASESTKTYVDSCLLSEDVKEAVQKGYTPDLKKVYKEQIVDKLIKEFNYSTIMQVPKLTKITLNMGVGDATQDKKLVDDAQEQLSTITGQKAVITMSKSDISNIKPLLSPTHNFSGHFLISFPTCQN